MNVEMGRKKIGRIEGEGRRRENGGREEMKEEGKRNAEEGLVGERRRGKRSIEGEETEEEMQ